jgi:hypothetical protein
MDKVNAGDRQAERETPRIREAERQPIRSSHLRPSTSSTARLGGRYEEVDERLSSAAWEALVTDLPVRGRADDLSASPRMRFQASVSPAAAASVGSCLTTSSIIDSILRSSPSPFALRRNDVHRDRMVAPYVPPSRSKSGAEQGRSSPGGPITTPASKPFPQGYCRHSVTTRRDLVRFVRRRRRGFCPASGKESAVLADEPAPSCGLVQRLAIDAVADLPHVVAAVKPHWLAPDDLMDATGPEGAPVLALLGRDVVVVVDLASTTRAEPRHPGHVPHARSISGPRIDATLARGRGRARGWGERSSSQARRAQGHCEADVRRT